MTLPKIGNEHTDGETPSAAAAPADADEVLGPYAGYVYVGAPLQLDYVGKTTVCLHAWDRRLGVTLGAEVDGTELEASTFLEADEARDLAATLEELAEEIDDG
jgi:hypothetical protein